MLEIRFGISLIYLAQMLCAQRQRLAVAQQYQLDNNGADGHSQAYQGIVFLASRMMPAYRADLAGIGLNADLQSRYCAC